MRLRNLALFAIGTLMISACRSVPEESIRTADKVDLERFMGDWYVVANIPTWLEQGAHNAVESYELTPEGHVATRFRFRDGGFDGPVKVYEPTGFVRDASNAVWGMQFFWPIRAEYLVLFVDEDYQRTVIGRSKRDYVWLMARTPELSEADYAELVEVVAAAGYDPKQLQRVPQRWPESGTDGS
jgi:apolipoprotein D and lipocalin family protein